MNKSSPNPPLPPSPAPRLDQPEWGIEARTERAINRTNQLGVDTDTEAVAMFLLEFKDSPNTFRTYKKECERLLLWVRTIRHCELSALTRRDFDAYRDFMAKPPLDWCGPPVRQTLADESRNPKWRPFTGPMKPGAIKQALVILNTLFNYLVQADYLEGNPLALMRRRTTHDETEHATRVERFLEQRDWELVWRQLERYPTHTPKQQDRYERLRFLLSVLYLLGLRISELTEHTMGDFQSVQSHWRFKVIGKGRKKTWLPVSSELLQALLRYRQHLQLEGVPRPDDETPLIPSLATGMPISTRRVHAIIKNLFFKTADAIQEEDPARASRLRQASAHWLRHTTLTHLAHNLHHVSGAGLKDLQRLGRHSKVDTTAGYLHSEDDVLFELSDLLKLPKDDHE